MEGTLAYFYQVANNVHKVQSLFFNDIAEKAVLKYEKIK